MIIDYIQNKNNIEKYSGRIIHYLEDPRLKSKINSSINFQGVNVTKAFDIILKNSNIEYYKIKFNSTTDIKKLKKYCVELTFGNLRIPAGIMVCEALQALISWLNLLKNGAIYSFYYDLDKDIYVLEINNI